MRTKPEYFSGKWITSRAFSDLLPQPMFHREQDKSVMPTTQSELSNRHILFRQHFELTKAQKVVIRISADDYYKLYINGEFVGQGPTPGYAFHFFYNEIDLTPYVHTGRNTIAVHTYYQGLINRVWVSGDRRHGLIFDLFADDKLIAYSDENVLCHEHTGFTAVGTVGYDTQFLECYDASASEVGFELPEFDDTSWDHACFHRHAEDYQLFLQPTQMLMHESIRPVAVTRIGDCVRIDFGACYVGALRVKMSGPHGSKITMHFAQELEDDGSLRWHLRCNCNYEEFFILSGKPEDTLVQYDYKSFRYAELQLPPGCQLDAASIELQARHYPFALRASCNRDDAPSQAIWQLCVNTFKYGAQEVIQDCMDREKGYYLGDGCYTMLTYCLLTHDYPLMEKFFDDFLRTSFINRGLVTCANCALMQEIAEFPLIMFTLLAEYCELVGNRQFVAERYDAFADILDFYRESYAEEDGLLNHLDKWCIVEWPQNMRDGYDVELPQQTICHIKHNVINAYYIGAIKCLNKVAHWLGREPYADIAPLQAAFIRAFYLPEKHLFRDSVQSDHISMPGNIFAAFYELAPDQTCIDNILAMIREKRLSCCLLFATFPLLAFLKKQGEEELLHSLLTDEHTWLNMLSEGATRTFEGWSRDTKWNTSLFHLTLSFAASFLTDWPLIRALTLSDSAKFTKI